MEKARTSPNRIPALPRSEKHWNWSAAPSKLTLHKRLHRKHGPASAHPCADCGSPAKDWSLEPGRAYSDDINDYKARCRRCHLKLDMTPERKLNVSQGLKKAYQEGRR